jgi:hypothetical protein
MSVGKIKKFALNLRKSSKWIASLFRGQMPKLPGRFH